MPDILIITQAIHLGFCYLVRMGRSDTHPSLFLSNSNRKIKSLGSKDTHPQPAYEKPVRLHFYQLRAPFFPEGINRFFGEETAISTK